MYFWNYRLKKTWLDHSLKSAVSEHPSTVNMLKDIKHLRNLNESTLIIFFITLKETDLENIWFSEILGAFVNALIADDKYPLQNCEKPSYLKNENFFSNYLFFCWNLHQLWNILKKRWSSLLMYFRNYRLWKTWLDHSLNSGVSQHPLIVNMFKHAKRLLNLHEGTLINFFNTSEGNWLINCFS